MRMLMVVIMSFSLMACASARAQQPPAAAACAGPEFSQMDFWLGDWDLRWDASPGQPAGAGVNHITRDFGNCVIHEHFSGDASTGNLIGESWSLYHAPAQRWRQTWVDNQGGYFALVGGVEDGRLILVSYSIATHKPNQRMVYEDITADSLTWRWQRTTDEGATWVDAWVIHYTRRR